MDYKTIALILGIVLLVIAQAFFRGGGNVKPRVRGTWIAVILIGLFALGYFSPGTLGFLDKTVSLGGSTLAIGDSGSGDNSGVVTTYQPTATYTTKDKYSTTVVTGTSYYKVNDKAATTTAVTNVNVGDAITYWVDNSSVNNYWVRPVNAVAGPSITRIEATAWRNGTATVTGYDLVNRQSVANGVYNTTMDPNSQANIEITVQGTSKRSAMPFGGAMVVEANSSISSITCNGDDILSSNPYHLTYTTTYTANSYRVWGIGPTIDDGTGSVRKITCQFNNGATDNTGGTYYVKFIPANYYVTNDGRIVLDTEKYDNQDTTRTGSTLNGPLLTGFWG